MRSQVPESRSLRGALDALESVFVQGLLIGAYWRPSGGCRVPEGTACVLEGRAFPMYCMSWPTDELDIRRFARDAVEDSRIVGTINNLHRLRTAWTMARQPRLPLAIRAVLVNTSGGRTRPHPSRSLAWTYHGCLTRLFGANMAGVTE
jgi:hypothetical protein